MPEYGVSIWQRVPASSTSPTFTELDPIAGWTALGWGRELNAADAFHVAADVATIPDTVASRLIALDATPLEMEITRDGDVVARGPIVDWEIQAGTITLNGRGLLYYLDYMVVESAVAYLDTDQATIVKGLIDTYQALAYGNYGLVTTGLTAVGVLRSMSIATGEFPTVGKKVAAWLDNLNGMDLWVDPTTREVLCAYPTRGVDRTGTVIMDARVIRDNHVYVSVAAGTLASEGFSSAGGPRGGGTALVGAYHDTTLRATFGRAGYAEAASTSIIEQATVDGHAEANQKRRATPALSLAPGQFVGVSGVDVGDFDEGDLVTFSYDAGLGLIETTERIHAYRVNVDDREMLEVTFA